MIFELVHGVLKGILITAPWTIVGRNSKIHDDGVVQEFW